MELKGKTYWRSLEQLAQTNKFKEFLHDEFPKGTAELAHDNGWSRRSFLTTMGASMALAGLAGCRRPVEKIVPYVTRPEEIDPGVPLKYATTMPFGLSAYGVVVTTHNGRPTFIEGNELHPSSQGAVNPFVQASLLDLYDPDRSKSVLKGGKESSWDDFVTWWQVLHAKYQETGGEGLAVLSETFNSPTLARLKRQFHETFPKAKWVAWEPISDENIYKGVEMATGQVLQPLHDFSKAKVILSLDCDFLGTESESISAARGFSEARRVLSQSDEMNRLYVVEPSMTVTGMMADHRRGMNPLEDHLIGTIGTMLAHIRGPAHWSFSDFEQAFYNDMIKARRAGEESLCVGGRSLSPQMHAKLFELNHWFGKEGSAASYVQLPDAALPDTDALGDLVASMRGGEVETLLMLGGNPVNDSPADFDFLAGTAKVANVVQLSDHVNETTPASTWHVNRAHYLESWGDARAADGTVSVIQPMINPLHGGHDDASVYALLTFGQEATSHDVVRETLKPMLGGSDFESGWRKLLHDGVLEASALPLVVPKINEDVYGERAGSGLKIVFVPGATFDGRFANNGWLQELPDPVTKLTWGNAALISPTLAEQHDLDNEDVVKLEVNGRSIEIPVWISPGQADNSIAVALGYGRTAAGRVGNGVGVNAESLRTSENMWFATGVTITKTGRKQELACTQDHGSMEGRPIIRENTLAGYKEKAEFFPAAVEHPPEQSLWNEHKYDQGYQWGMAIDLNACTGCNACVIGCQAENNVPVIGKEQVRNGREMHWMRIDRYYGGDASEPEVAVQPMNCQHCEMAPCEQVCPVAATSHDEEGLNVMVYNRCIGTRYCSNNCPYKVRRFNFFNYTNELTETTQMAQNPEVTVRSRGVMEKCTYCIQRLVAAKATAKREGRTVADGEIKMACEAACPSGAIVFGNINDPDSRVSQLRTNDRQYRVLEELNTRPRTTYLAKLRNPNPALIADNESKDDGHQG
jgi:molybdopterin-containing oxidoreductase family iron-sulfur binding subunit